MTGLRYAIVYGPREWYGRALTIFLKRLLGGQSPLYLPGLWASMGVTAFFLWFGLRQFRKTEKSFADLI